MAQTSLDIDSYVTIDSSSYFDDVSNVTSSNVSDTFWLNNGCHAFEFFLSTVVIGFLCVVGLAGNVMSIFVLNMDRQHRVAAFLLQALAVADSCVLLLSVVVLSGIVGPMQIPSVGLRLMNVIPYLKVYINPIGYVMHSIAIWIVVLLAINRYIAICKPFHAQKWLTMRKTAFQVAFVIGLSVAVNVPRWFQSEVVYNNESMPVKRATAFGSHPGVEIGYFNAFYTSAVLIIPLIFLFGLNIKLVYALQVSRRNMQRNSLYYIGSQEKNITRVMIIVVIQVLVCHTPDRLLTTVRQIDRTSGIVECPHPLLIAQHFANVLIIVNCSTNFLIYSIVRAKFRRNFFRLFCRCLPKGLVPLQRRISESSNGSFGGSKRSFRMTSENSAKKDANGNGLKPNGAADVSEKHRWVSGTALLMTEHSSEPAASEPRSPVSDPGQTLLEPESPKLHADAPRSELGSPLVKRPKRLISVTYRPDTKIDDR